MENKGDSDNSYWCAWNNLQTIVKGLEDLETREQVETIQTTELSRSTRILRRVLEPCRDSILIKKNNKENYRKNTSFIALNTLTVSQQRGKTLNTNKCPGYDAISSDSSS